METDHHSVDWTGLCCPRPCDGAIILSFGKVVMLTGFETVSPVVDFVVVEEDGQV